MDFIFSALLLMHTSATISCFFGAVLSLIVGLVHAVKKKRSPALAVSGFAFLLWLYLLIGLSVIAVRPVAVLPFDMSAAAVAVFIQKDASGDLIFLAVRRRKRAAKASSPPPAPRKSVQPKKPPKRLACFEFYGSDSDEYCGSCSATLYEPYLILNFEEERVHIPLQRILYCKGFTDVDTDTEIGFSLPRALIGDAIGGTLGMFAFGLKEKRHCRVRGAVLTLKYRAKDGKVTRLVLYADEAVDFFADKINRQRDKLTPPPSPLLKP